MKKLTFSLVALLALCSCTKSTPTLKDAFRDDFYVGCATQLYMLENPESPAYKLIETQFSSIVPDNDLKPERLHPTPDTWTWDAADAYIEFGEQHNMWIIGHVLVWHSQTPDWFFHDEEGNLLTRDALIERMRDYIYTVVGRYRGRINGWDVCNECILDDGSYRNSYYYQIIGPDFISLAFQFAHEADPDVELYYNDYSMSKPGKRETVCRIVREMQDKGLRIDAVGMQSHNGLDWPDMEEYEQSLLAYSALGVDVNITELDLNALPRPEEFAGAGIEQNFELRDELNPYKDGLTPEAEAEINQRWMDFFELYHRHADKIGRVTFWAVGDADSWLNDWPIPGRTAYASCFDREYKAKPIVETIITTYGKQ